MTVLDVEVVQTTVMTCTFKIVNTAQVALRAGTVAEMYLPLNQIQRLE